MKIARASCAEMVPTGRDRLADAADRAGQEHRFAADFTCFAGDLDGAEVDVADAPFEAIGGQPNAVRGEGVGLDHLGAGRDVGAVDGLDEVRLQQVQLVEAAFVWHTLGVQLGAHAPVEQDGRARGQAVEEGTPHGERDSVLGTRVA